MFSAYGIRGGGEGKEVESDNEYDFEDVERGNDDTEDEDKGNREDTEDTDDEGKGNEVERKEMEKDEGTDEEEERGNDRGINLEDNFQELMKRLKNVKVKIELVGTINAGKTTKELGWSERGEDDSDSSESISHAQN